MENAGSIANKKVFALIGGIASGKTAVSNIFASLGAYIIDADVISREMTAAGSEGETKIMKLFPDCVRGGRLNRRLLKEKVFSDEDALKTLNNATHPLIISEIHRQISLSKGVVIVVMPVPKELRRYNAVLNVYAPLDIRIERLIKRDNIDEKLARKIMAAQLSDDEAAAVADFTFINDGDEQKLRECVVKWWEFFVEK